MQTCRHADNLGSKRSKEAQGGVALGKLHTANHGLSRQVVVPATINAEIVLDSCYTQIKIEMHHQK